MTKLNNMCKVCGQTPCNCTSIEESATSHAELAKLAHDAYVQATRKGNGPMAAHYLKQYEKHKANNMIHT